MKNLSSYNFAADLIRVLAISGVVIIHIANSVYARPDFFGGSSWWFAIILNSLSRVSIPLFILLSGYFILNKKESVKQSFHRTLHRLGIPLLVWFIIDCIWNGGNPTLESINHTLIFRLLSVNVFDLYFFIILIGLYSVAPLLRTYLSFLSTSSQKKFMGITLLAGMLYVGYQYITHQCSPANSFIYWFPYTGLFIAGYVLGKNSITKPQRIFALYGISLLITITMSFLYYYLSSIKNTLLVADGCLSYYSDAYLSINVVIMSLTLFMLIMHSKNKNLPLFIKKVIFSIARVSLGIYIFHTFLLDILDEKFHMFTAITPLWLYLIIKWFVIFFLSYLMSFLVIKIPFIKRSLGETK